MLDGGAAGAALKASSGPAPAGGRRRPGHSTSHRWPRCASRAGPGPPAHRPRARGTGPRARPSSRPADTTRPGCKSGSDRGSAEDRCARTKVVLPAPSSPLRNTTASSSAAGRTPAARRALQSAPVRSRRRTPGRYRLTRWCSSRVRSLASTPLRRARGPSPAMACTNTPPARRPVIVALREDPGDRTRRTSPVPAVAMPGLPRSHTRGAPRAHQGPHTPRHDGAVKALEQRSSAASRSCWMSCARSRADARLPGCGVRIQSSRRRCRPRPAG